jgi:hypothetical protein
MLSIIMTDFSPCHKISQTFDPISLWEIDYPNVKFVYLTGDMMEAISALT